MFALAASRTEGTSSRRQPVRSLGFTLTETLVAMGVCSVALSGFYISVAQGIRIVKNATEQGAASHLLEQRIEGLRARPMWGNVITISGIKAALTEETPSVAVLGGASETCSVGPYPGDSIAFSVTREADGTLSSTGRSLPSSQTSVRVVTSVSWGMPSRRTRSVATVFTKGGL